MPDKAREERQIIRRLLRQLAKHPRSKKLRRALRRHRLNLRTIYAQRRAPLRLKAFAYAEDALGIREVGGNNRGPEVEAIIRSNGGVPGEPWCGDFVAYCYLKAGAKSVVRAWAAVRYLAKLLAGVSRPRRGHVVIFSFDHTGMFDRWAPEYGAGKFLTIEGNTGKDGAVSDSSGGGDGVHRRLRHVSQVSSFRRVIR
jgi:hypothetical protein